MVRSTEVPPQMFRDGIGVVVEGTFDKSQVFASNRLMLAFPADNPAGIVTISVGAATGSPSGSLTADELIARADAALYRSKDHGRNQVTMADQDLPDGFTVSGGYRPLWKFAGAVILFARNILDLQKTSR